MAPVRVWCTQVSIGIPWTAVAPEEGTEIWFNVFDILFVVLFWASGRTTLVTLDFTHFKFLFCTLSDPRQNFPVSDVLVLFGQFELPALEKKALKSFSDVLVMQSFSEKDLISERDTDHLKQQRKQRIVTRTCLVVPSMYGRWMAVKGLWFGL